MKLLTVVNDIEGLEPRQTTTYLMARAAERGWMSLGTDVLGLGLGEQGELVARVRAVPSGLASFELLPEALRGVPGEVVTLSAGDVVLLRTNPSRDARGWAHSAALDMVRAARDTGVAVISDPDGLARAASKVYLSAFPEWLRSRTLISRDPVALRAFAASLDGPCVLKPLRGTHGRDVFMARQGEPNMGQIIDVLTRQGWAMAQAFIPEASEGDVRILLLEGELLSVDGKSAAVRRRPGGDDFRSNVHVGGRAEPTQLTDAMHAAVEAVGPRLKADGIFLAGLDFIGGKVVEINVYSPGGVPDAGEFYGVDFGSAVLDAIGRHGGPQAASSL